MRITLQTHKLVKFNLTNSVSVGLNILLDIGVCWEGVSGEFNTHLSEPTSSSKHKLAHTTCFTYSNYKRFLKQRIVLLLQDKVQVDENMNNSKLREEEQSTDDETSRRNFQNELAIAVTQKREHSFEARKTKAIP